MKRISLLLIAFAVAGALLQAQEMCPEKIQAVFIAKMIPFTLELSGTKRDEVKIGVLNSDDMVAFLNQALSTSSERVKVIKVSMGAISGIHILYVPHGTASADVKKLKEQTRAGKILSIAGDPLFFKDFNYAVTFGLVNDKPKLMISVSASEEEGAKFASSLLQLATSK